MGVTGRSCEQWYLLSPSFDPERKQIKSQIKNHNPQITNTKPHRPNQKSKITNHNSQITNTKPQNPGHNAQFKNNRRRTKYLWFEISDLWFLIPLIPNENKLNLKSKFTTHKSNLNPRNAGTLKRWNIGTMEHWNIGTLELWILIIGKSEIHENFLFPISNFLSLITLWKPKHVNWKWEIGNRKFRYRKSLKISYFQFPISCPWSRYENQNTLIGNGKWEIGNSLIGNRKSLELWNIGTLEPSNPFLNPLRGKDWFWNVTSIVLHPLTGKWKDLLPFALRSTLIQQSSAL